MYPDWTQYFMGLAFIISLRSKDSQTKHGCLICDRNNHIVGTGYNSFPRGLPDHLIPNTRPEKYQWVCHAENNALLNTTINLWTIKEGGVAYITGKPCLGCLKSLWNGNVTEIYYANCPGWTKDEEEKEVWDKLVEWTGIKIHIVDYDLSWIYD